MPETNRPTVLIVEDEALIAMNEQMILKRYGYEAIYVTSGNDAIEAVRNTPEIDLVLMDIDLGPGIDGTVAAEAILKIREIPVVFLSSHTEPEVVEKTERITSYGYIVKNSGETVLLASMKMAFRLFDARRNARRHEEALQDSEDRFRLLFDEAPLGYQSLDTDGRFLRVNRAWLDTFGYQRDDVIGRSFGDFLDAEDHDLFPDRFAGFKAKGSIHTAFQMKRKDGEQRYIVFEGRIATDETGKFKQTHCILRDETERQRAVEALRKGEAFRRKMVTNIQDVIVIIDRDGIVRYKSPNIERLFGWSPEEVVGNSAWDNVHPDDRNAALDLFTSIAPHPGATGSLRFRYLHKDGTYRWIEFTGTNLLHDTDISGIIGNYHDITEQRRWEHTVESSIYELKKSQEVANVGNWIWRIPENSLVWSDQMYKIFGVEKDGFTGNLAEVLSTRIHPDDREAVAESNASVIERATPIPLEYRVVRPDGSIRTVWAEAGELERDDEGVPVLLRGIVLDITERKRMEDALRERTYILSKAEELTHSGGWKWDIAEDRFTFSDGWLRIHGTGHETMSRSELLQLAHPDDRDEIESALAVALGGHGAYDIEHRIVRADTREERTVRALGEVLYDTDGSPVRILGAAQDITEDKRREVLLKARQDAISASMDAIALADHDGVLTYVNPAFLTLWGYQTVDDVLGRPAIVFWDLADQAQRVIDALETKGHWAGELIGKRADGTVFDAQLSSSVVTDEKGQSVFMIGIFRDITESKRTENRMNALLREKDLVLKETHHRIKNSFATIEGLLNIQAETAVHPDASVALRNAGSRAASMRALYERLLLTERYLSVPARDYLEDLAESMLAVHVGSGRIDLRTQIDEIEFDSRTLFPLGTIVVELITNCLKHAYAPDESGAIELTLDGEPDSWILSIRDYGRGFSLEKDTERPPTFGLMLVQMLSDQLQAEFATSLADGRGTVATVRREIR